MEMLQLRTITIPGPQRGMIMSPPAGRRLSALRLKRLVSSSFPASSQGQGSSSSPRSISSPAAPAAPAAAVASDSAPSPPATGRSSPWLLVGLGNPGTKYEGTRHNVGFEMIDTVARAEGISLATIQFKSLLGKGRIGDAPVLLAKPQTFMNLSGSAVRSLASYYKIPPERVLTVYDDLDLEFAVMKLLPKGGHGGHNGMKSIIDLMGTRNFARLRIGIGRPPGTMDPRAFVLQKFSSSERQEVKKGRLALELTLRLQLDYALDRAVQAFQLITTEGLDKAVSSWNQVRKSKVSKMAYSDVKLP